MGIRFKCHHCFHSMHLKNIQAGKRGVCPACRGRFRIPKQSQDFSTEVHSTTGSDAEFLSLLEPNLLKRRKNNSTDRPALTTTSNPAIEDRPFTFLSPNQIGSSFDNDPLDGIDSIPSRNIATQPTKSNEHESRPASRRDIRQETSAPKSRSLKGATNGEKVATSSKSDKNKATTQPKSDRKRVTNGSKTSQTSKATEGERAYFVSPPSGGQYGPASQLAIDAWIEQRRVTADTLVWYDGLDGWRPASEIFPHAFVDVASDDLSSNIAIRKSRFDGLLPDIDNHALDSSDAHETQSASGARSSLTSRNLQRPGEDASRYVSEADGLLMAVQLKQKSEATIRMYWTIAAGMSVLVIVLFFGLIYLVTR